MHFCGLYMSINAIYFLKRKGRKANPSAYHIVGKDIPKTILRIDTGLFWNEKDVLSSFMKDLGFA